MPGQQGTGNSRSSVIDAMRTAPAGLREVERVPCRVVFGELQVRDLRHRGAEEHLRLLLCVLPLEVLQHVTCYRL